ncbi:diaminopimelate decarboxylase [Marisediminitalea aggregata]|uniref:Diaminopimelate decarboxylase n=1 Tax=Marisediminitalea aggregata TaxID=634436 RepID=A0A1M5ER86_9ALTE|nr:diaminopimelate decarboxylase [Marisediminitalea aggregata]MAP20688.1 diaminopimelate decarboxylase [Alteromonadaceae bacterium]MCP3862090.1 diaminopimelate decarboxylase [Aestuariibacter sp.]MEC7826783.1 diaminopimelate decarboxylase [Pseudomonadota bacterium]BBO29673.1 diaminopimelate decarboxylase [Alteromonas sp. I4]HBY38462.1 diaminopimelate decarboxylase [Alteromonas sp.]
MDHFSYQNQTLHAEDVSVKDLASQYGTPLYIYSRATLERHWKAFDEALGDHPHLICYAVKANSNIGVLSVLAKLGSGFDIVSGGELARVKAAGGDMSKVVFSGVGKTPEEIEFALEEGIHCFNVESEPELHRINEVAGKVGKQAPISLRINPDVDAKTHPYISTGLKANKFGIARERAIAVYELANSLPNLNVVGMDCHIGSQLTETGPFVDALERLLVLIDELASKGIHIKHLDVGGGLGVTYRDETPPHPREYAAAIAEKMKGRENLTLIMEPGRAIAANAGIMVTKVEFVKSGEEKNFAIVDAAMNDLIRPSLYSAWMSIIPVVEGLDRETHNYDVVGPVCETGDFIGKDRELGIESGDYLAVRSAGAYGFVMASNYNSRCRPAELMVDGSDVHVVRERENLKDLWKGEHKLT